METAFQVSRGLVSSTRSSPPNWQGDEAKWQRTFEDGKAFFVDEPAVDESSGSYAIQLSVPVRPDSDPIGALTLTLRLSADGTPAAKKGGTRR